jgi:hypothetical protein
VHTELKSSTLETSSDDAQLPPHAFDGLPESMMEMRQVDTTHVSQLHAFALLPDALGRVQRWGIRRQALQAPLAKNS